MKALINAYLKRYPNESERLSRLTAQIERSDDLSDRKNEVGHVTASAVVIAADDSAVLFVKNRGLNLWVLPGGHLEPGEQPREGALRELEEETGIMEVSVVHETPLDIDSHAIPARPERGEGAHFHHDFRFLCRARPDQLLKLQDEEIAGAKWLPISVLHTAKLADSLSPLVAKLQKGVPQ